MNPRGSLFNMKDFTENSPYFSDFYQFFNNLITVKNGSNSENKNPMKVIVITSAVESEGKTTLASYVSITGAVALQDYHLLIDGDMRRPTLHSKFGEKAENGLSEVLLGNKKLPDVIKVVEETPRGALHLITAGKKINNPFQLLTRDSTGQLITNLRNYYSRIIIDSPPIIPVSDTLRLSQLADGVVLVVRAGKTPREVVKRAINILKQARIPLLGVVLNDVGEILPYYYHKRYYHYEYGKSQVRKHKVPNHEK